MSNSHHIDNRIVEIVSRLTSKGIEGYDARTGASHNLGGARGWLETPSRTKEAQSKLVINRPELAQFMRDFNAPIITLNRVELDDDNNPIQTPDETTGEPRHNRVDSCMMLYVRQPVPMERAISRLKELLPDVAEDNAIELLSDVIKVVPEAEKLAQVSFIKGPTGLTPTRLDRLIFLHCPSGSAENMCLWSNRKRSDVATVINAVPKSAQDILAKIGSINPPI